MPVATLILANGERKVLASGSNVTIGRHSTCDIVLNDSQVSRRHGRLVHTTDGWHYSDLGSRNGTEINGQACTDAVLGTNDVLTIGRTPITFDSTQREMECA
jgi:pSer/pThr/pTyr-binding forkhead associated (FHA) protein